MKKEYYVKPIVKMMAMDDEELLAGSATVLEEDENGNPFQDLGGAGETGETGGNLGKHFNAWDTWEEEGY